jgi:phosphatidylserine decarboxylase
MKPLTERLFIFLQRILPTRLIGAITYRLTRNEALWLKNGLIRGFVRAYPVDTDEMDRENPCDYKSFNAFFTRELKSGARPITTATHGICSPADGKVQQAGHLRDGQLLQAKGMDYRLDQLLDDDGPDSRRFANGAFLTIYLAPHNYHRVHAPLAGTVRRMNFIPGARYSVNETTARHVPRLFARNERVACYCRDGTLDYWLVFVGAMNVASVNTAWSGEIAPGRAPRQTHYDGAEATLLHQGDYFGHFNMGSTVIIVLPPERVTWDSRLEPGKRLRVGERIGQF